MFYHEIRLVLDEIMKSHDLTYMEYSDFHNFKEIGSGSYRTVYTAIYKNHLEEDVEEIIILKRFKSFDRTPELFISEVSNNDNWQYQLQ